jgi:16S rRNA (cytosine967-C5)-methyltransferase
MELVYGVLRRQRLLEMLLGKMVRRRPGDFVRAILLAAFYELLYMKDSPDYAVVHSFVEIAAHKYGRGRAGLVNAVLRGFLRGKDKWIREMKTWPLPVRVSHPDILYHRWVKSFGEQATVKLCEWNNSRPDVVIRINTSKVNSPCLLERMKDRGLDVHPHPFRPAGFFVLPHGIPLPDVPGYSEGWFWVQDPAAAPAVELLDAQPGEHILDACAAPGGKSLAIADYCGDQVQIMAIDLYKKRLQRLRGSVLRTGFTGIKVIQGDARCLDTREWPVRLFDRILLDVPCSNTGVIRRRPDARWRFSRDRLDGLTALQFLLVKKVLPLLKPGGVLVYSTCSLEPEENAMQVEHCCSTHPGLVCEQSHLLRPPSTGTDGAFAARLRYQ